MGTPENKLEDCLWEEIVDGVKMVVRDIGEGRSWRWFEFQLKESDFLIDEYETQSGRRGLSVYIGKLNYWIAVFQDDDVVEMFINWDNIISHIDSGVVRVLGKITQLPEGATPVFNQERVG
jgi:hypothetical protein